MIVHEYGKISSDALLETLESLRGDKGADVLHLYLENDAECERFQTLVSQIEANGGWHFEIYADAPMFCTARYY